MGHKNSNDGFEVTLAIITFCMTRLCHTAFFSAGVRRFAFAISAAAA